MTDKTSKLGPKERQTRLTEVLLKWRQQQATTCAVPPSSGDSACKFKSLNNNTQTHKPNKLGVLVTLRESGS